MADGITWLPPARRGDIEQLIAGKLPGIIGLADGTFHAYPSVSHVELREAMAAGWTVYGLCSMGAIRASEMHHMGMRPWGRVAKMFCEDANFADDEVALVHGSEPPYAPITEPMIHIREFCLKARECGWLSVAQAEMVIRNLRERWYAERTIMRVREAISHQLGISQLPTAIDDALGHFKAFRLKQADLNSFVTDRPWLGERNE